MKKLFITLGIAGLLATGGVAFGQLNEKPQIGDVLGSKQVILHKTQKVDGNIERIPGTAYQAVKYAYIAGEIQDAPNELVNRRTAHSRTFKRGNTYETEIVGGVPQYYKDENGKWWQADYATTTSQRLKNLPKSPQLKKREAPVVGVIYKAFAAIDTFFPDADAETTTTDGYARVRDSYSGVTWQIVWEKTTASSTTSLGDTRADAVNDSATTVTMEVAANDGSTDDYTIRRGFFYFDTSAIPSENTVKSASLDVTIASVVNRLNDGRDYVNVVQVAGNNIQSDTAVSNEDYDQISSPLQDPTKGSTDHDITNDSGEETVTFTFNSSGVNWIAKSGEVKPSGATPGITYLGIRLGHDLENIDPNTLGSGEFPDARDQNLWQVYSADETGTTKDPTLTVTHFGPPPTTTPTMLIQDSKLTI